MPITARQYWLLSQASSTSITIEQYEELRLLANSLFNLIELNRSERKLAGFLYSHTDLSMDEIKKHIAKFIDDKPIEPATVEALERSAADTIQQEIDSLNTQEEK